ncbi:MAG: glycosyltransferase family 2 protein [Acetatifactor sp.]
MQLSVIVPVYNMEADGKLAYCLDSLVNQTIADYEIIAVDDASTDGSLRVLRDYEKRYPDKVKVLSLPENHRQGGAKNQGLAVCKGDYIGFVDSDDWVAVDCFEKLLKKVSETGADVVACDFCYVAEHTMEPSERVPCNKKEQTGVLDHDRRAALFMNPGAAVTKIYKRNLFFDEPFAFPEHMFYEDNAAGIELLRRATHFEYIEEPLYFYYQHGGSTVHVISQERCEDRLRAMRIMYGYAREHGYLEEFYPELEFKFTNLFYQNTLFSYMQGKQRKNLGFLRRMGKEMRETFPDFQKNPYYEKQVHPEEKKLMRMQQKSTLVFFLYYKALYFWRGLKKRKG